MMVVLMILATCSLIYVYALGIMQERSESQERTETEMIESQIAYNEYRRKFARDRKITIDEATNYQAVQNYKEYLEEEHEGKIVEGGV